jgi:hypothetical protein
MGYRAGPVTLSMYIGKHLTNVEPFQKYPAINTRALAQIRRHSDWAAPARRIRKDWARRSYSRPEINSDKI